MTRTETHLFHGSAIEDHIDQTFRSLAKRVDAITTAEALEAQAADISAAARMDACTLRRDHADFTVKEGARNVTVRVVIPLEGNTRLLTVSPSDGGGIGPYASVEDGWLTAREGHPELSLSQDFPIGTDIDTVRAWAKDTVDSIESRLAIIQQRIDGYNATIQSRLDLLLDRRHTVLDTGTALRDGLTRGI